MAKDKPNDKPARSDEGTESKNFIEEIIEADLEGCPPYEKELKAMGAVREMIKKI